MSNTAPIERVDLTKCSGECIRCKQYEECSKAYNFWIEGADMSFWTDPLPEWEWDDLEILRSVHDQTKRND